MHRATKMSWPDELIFHTSSFMIKKKGNMFLTGLIGIAATILRPKIIGK